MEGPGKDGRAREGWRGQGGMEGTGDSSRTRDGPVVEMEDSGRTRDGGESGRAMQGGVVGQGGSGRARERGRGPGMESRGKNLSTQQSHSNGTFLL
jgi:hypothetical protein